MELITNIFLDNKHFRHAFDGFAQLGHYAVSKNEEREENSDNDDNKHSIVIGNKELLLMHTHYTFFAH